MRLRVQSAASKSNSDESKERPISFCSAILSHVIYKTGQGIEHRLDGVCGIENQPSQRYRIILLRIVARFHSIYYGKSTGGQC